MVNLIRKSEVECVLNYRSLLGESPVWSRKDKCLFWVDIEGYSFNRFNPITRENIATKTNQRISCLAIDSNDGFIVATENGFHKYNPQSNKLSLITDPENNIPNNRFNDGKCDRAGRFWAGTMVQKGLQKNASLYCLDNDYNCTKKYGGLILSNGIAWSPDDKVMYLADTRIPIVWAFDYDIQTADISNRRVFIEFDENEGVPDGAAIDNLGGYWIAVPRASQVRRYTDKGKIDTIIELPITKPTMCAFGGDGLTTIYITSNSYQFTKRQLEEQPLAGSIFALNLNYQGMPEPEFRGN